MPIPEDLLIYGRTDLQPVIAHAQPVPGAGQQAFNEVDRHVTRGVTFHFSHGWWYRAWRYSHPHWFGTAFNIDLDGTLFQCVEMDVRTLHVAGIPHFTGRYTFANDTAVGVEVCRFGAFSQRPNGTCRPSGYNTLIFAAANEPADGLCNYSGGSHPPGGTLSFNVRKMRGGTLVSRRQNNRDYYVKLHEFDDARNPKGNAASGRSAALYDALFTEEQTQTMIWWAKAMCEMLHVPKQFIADPDTGAQHPWIADGDLVGPVGRGGSTERAEHDERSERIKYFQGIFGHVSAQRNRFDPGPSVDYYRIKRGISDEWWLPSGGARALDYLDDGAVGTYMQMASYRSEGERAAMFSRIERQTTGFFPFGENRVWHGGVHLDGSGPLYAMANGRVVCARVTNGNYNMRDAPPGTTVSRCFVLVRHDVHVLDEVGATSDHWTGTRDLIDYREGSARTLYTLYMHVEPYIDNTAGTVPAPEGRLITHNARGEYATNWDDLPWWLNRYMVDHPNDANVVNGGLIFPDERIELSDVVGWAGTYITGRGSGGVPGFGTTAHVELFTPVDPATFPGSPWEAGEVIEDPNDDVICDVGLVDSLILDFDEDGLEASDIRECLPSLREKAVKFRSAWSLTSKNQLGQQLVDWFGRTIESLGEVVDGAAWQQDILPLMFYDDMRAGSTEAVIGPFFSEKKVWHLHPLVFMRWMNDRVDRHEQVMRDQDKRRNNETTNLVIEDRYVVGWQNLAGTGTTLARDTGQRYPEAKYGGNSFEVRVDVLADQDALSAADQTQTRLHRLLLRYLDHMTDARHGLTVTRAWDSTGATAARAVHRNGDAVLVTPTTATDAGEWFLMLRHTQISVDFFNTRYPEETMWFQWTDQDGETPADVAATGAEMTRRIAAAADSGDAVLTAAPALAPAVLSAMRLQVRVARRERQFSVRFDSLTVHDNDRWWLDAEWTMRFKVDGEMVCFVDRVAVNDGSVVPLPPASSTRTLYLDAATADVTLSAVGRNYGASGRLPIDPASHVVPLSTYSPGTSQSLTFGPASGDYEIAVTITEL